MEAGKRAEVLCVLLGYPLGVFSGGEVPLFFHLLVLLLQ